MKILEITFKNLNSLRGEWRIDLTDNAYTADGIFAITGPTGAGKTTIFDAICLALYGQTPRLGKIGGQTNEIMSRHTDDCYARVIFETHGREYICLWSQNKAGRNKQLQSAVHTLSEISGEILASKTNDTRAKVEEITGMDFPRFTQAMMLEQGGFDAFLRADKNDRAAILELITGTEIYSEISKLVYARTGEERTKLHALELLLEDNKLRLQESTPETLKEELAQESSRRAELASGFEKIKAAQNWHRELQRLETELSGTESEITVQQRRLEEFEPRRTRLDAAERSASLAADYASLIRLRREAGESRAKCSRYSAEISALETEISRAENDVLPKMQKMLAFTKGEITENPQVLEGKILLAVANYEQSAQVVTKLESALAESEETHKRAAASAEAALAAKEAAWQKRDNASRESTLAFDELMKSQTLTTEAVIAEQRRKLRPGSPCPLCGSLEHPSASHSHEATGNSGELFSRTERLYERVQECRKAYESASKEYVAAEDKYNAAKFSEESAKNDRDYRQREINAKKDERDALHNAVSQAIRPLNLENVRSTQDIKIQVKRWADYVKSIEDKITDVTAKTDKQKTVLKTTKKFLAVENENLSRITAELETLESSFRESLLAKNFADENEFSASYLESEKLEELRREYQVLTERMSSLRAKKTETEKTLTEQREQRVTELTREETDAEFSRQEKEIQELDGKIAVLGQKVKDAGEQQSRIDELTQNRDKQKETAENWLALNDLIGSAYGDKFRVFAQRITLDLVVNNANMYLQKMSGRYILKARPWSEKLELSVIDNEQAGELRPTENLSGGERFIISLALALGLSQIAGSKARVDSVFLDEGFGSLDEESLNTALDALAEIRREGRMIGIISHVAALQERIAAQIRVIPEREGMSVIEGPGCSREG